MTETNSSCLSQEDFKHLTCEHRELWGKMPRDMKSIILNNKGSKANLVLSHSNGNSNSNSKSSYKNLNPSSCSNEPIARANLHEILSELSIQNHEITDTNANEEVNEEENNTTLLAHSTTSKQTR